MTTSVDTWYHKAMVRTGERPVLTPEAREGALFPEREIPHLRHPLVQRLPASCRRELVARYLYQYLLYTTHLEVEVVNRAIEHILRGLPGLTLPPELRLEALSIYCDEGYHSLASLDVVQQFVKTTGITPAPYDFAPTLRRLDGTGHQLLPEDPVLAQLLQVIVFETVVTSILNEVPKDPSVCAVVRQVVQEHARDEGRHHAFFAAFFGQLWDSLLAEKRERVALCLPRLAHACLRWDTTPIAWSLEVAGLPGDDISQVLEDCYGDQAAIPVIRNATRHLTRLCESLGVLDVPGGREAFTELGLV